MTETEHLLVQLAEECAEVAHRVSKVLRFGFDDIGPGNTENNRQMLQNELTDLAAVIALLREDNLIPTEYNAEDIQNKKDKVAYFLDYAYRRGTLQVRRKS